MPCHINLGSECCGIFNKIQNRTVVCNECELELNKAIKAYNPKIVVYKDGSYKIVKSGITWEYENDKDWFTTISLNLI